MKRTFLTFIFTLSSFVLPGRDYQVFGPQGGLAMTVTLPENFNIETDKCPMVILMHGIFSSKSITPMPVIAKALAKEGIASIRFDFGGHWKSEGEMVKMTIEKEIEDALAMWTYARSLPYINKIVSTDSVRMRQICRNSDHINQQTEILQDRMKMLMNEFLKSTRSEYRSIFISF